MSIISAFSGKAVYLLLIAFAPYSYPIVPISIAESGHATVPVFVDGVGTREFVLDTGAEGSAVYENFSKAAGFRLAAKRETLVGQTGVESAAVVRLPSLILDGNRVEKDGTAVVISSRADGVPLNGIIGLDVFGQKLLDFNLPGRTVALHPTGSVIPAMHAVEAIAANPTTGGLLTVPVRLSAIDAVAVIDTGARKTRINWNLGKKLGFSSSSIMAGDVVHGATGNPVQASSATVLKVKLGKRLLSDMPVQVVDLPVFELFGVAEKPAVILGLDWLGETRLIVDFPQRRVWIVAVDD